MRSNKLEALEQRLAKAEERLERQNKRLTRHKELLEEVRPAAYRASSLYEILGAQVAALEERLQDLADTVGPARPAATDDHRAAARSLLDEVREEHRRIRVRFGVVTRYEERVRRLESALADELAAAQAFAHEAAVHGALADAPTHGAVDLPDEEPAAATPAPAGPRPR